MNAAGGAPRRCGTPQPAPGRSPGRQTRAASAIRAAAAKQVHLERLEVEDEIRSISPLDMAAPSIEFCVIPGRGKASNPEISRFRVEPAYCSSYIILHRSGNDQACWKYTRILV